MSAHRAGSKKAWRAKGSLEALNNILHSEVKAEKKLRKLRKEEARLAKLHSKFVEKANEAYVLMLSTRKQAALLESKEAMK